MDGTVDIETSKRDLCEKNKQIKDNTQTIQCKRVIDSYQRFLKKIREISKH